MRSILLAAPGWNLEPWADQLQKRLPGRALHVHPAAYDPASIDYALVWKPPPGLLGGLPRLQVIFSLGAGVDHLMQQANLPDVPIVRAVCDDLTRRMTEWVVLQVLIHHRKQQFYDRQQAARVWREIDQPAAADIGVGIMGMGVLGSDAAKALQSLGFRVAGWSRRPSSLTGVESFNGQDGLAAFLSRTHILVSLLPLTRETSGMLSLPLFETLARDHVPYLPVLINAGRGGSQVEAHIVRAVESGILAGASLDVFSVEPLDPSSALWTMPNVIITPHAAAASDARGMVPAIVEQIHRFEAGLPLQHMVDRQQSY